MAKTDGVELRVKVKATTDEIIRTEAKIRRISPAARVDYLADSDARIRELEMKLEEQHERMEQLMETASNLLRYADRYNACMDFLAAWLNQVGGRELYLMEQEAAFKQMFFGGDGELRR